MPDLWASCLLAIYVFRQFRRVCTCVGTLHSNRGHRPAPARSRSIRQIVCGGAGVVISPATPVAARRQKHSAPCRLCASAEQHSIRWQEKGSIRVGGTAECVFLAVAGRLVVRSLIGAGILLHTTTFFFTFSYHALPGYKYLRLSASSQAKHSICEGDF